MSNLIIDLNIISKHGESSPQREYLSKQYNEAKLGHNLLV
jgi:hypothetical protein